MAKIRKEETLETPVSSMIDVVFLLIIFFVVTAAVDEETVDDTIKLAQATNLPAIEKKDPRTITINVKKDGSINIATIPLTMVGLKQQLIELKGQFGVDFPIVIRASKDTLFKHIDQINAVIGECGLYRVRIAAIARE